MRAILVSVDYSDLLELTLPYNRHHFDEVMVVTTPKDIKTQTVAEKNNCRIYCTNSFYDDGAKFNKWKALEKGMDVFGRTGWICLMDADVLWPRENPIMYELGNYFKCGYLYTPLRRMMVDLSKLYDDLANNPSMNPQLLLLPEDQRKKYPVHRNVNEWAGYSQIFHVESNQDVLGSPPWHQIDWIHAGGADSFFQNKWPRDRKVRPPFEVLHLGDAGKNWFGRSTRYLDGTLEKDALNRYQSCMNIWETRRTRKSQGLDPFEPEKIKT